MPIVPIASELSKKAYSDNTKYNPLEVAYAMTESIPKGIMECLEKHKEIIENCDIDEFCIVYVLADDPLIKNLTRRKFYCWPYLPEPRPRQSVFLFNKKLFDITKRLWVLPHPATMSELATSNLIVHKRYQSMRDWSVAFYKKTFWEFIRYQHDIKMISQKEYFELHREELLKLGVDISNPVFSEPFDFSKIQIKDIDHANQPVAL